MKRLWLAIAAAAAIAGKAAAQPYSAEDQAHIAAIETGLPPAVVIKGRPAAPMASLQSRMAATRTPGVSIAFFQDGRILWTKSYGLADVASGRPVTAETQFQAASISKAVTAAAAMRLVQEGKLDLDEDINLRLSGWKLPESGFTAERKVTLRELLSHTAGLTVHGFDGYVAGAPLPTTIQILNGAPPANSPAVVSDTKPGEKWTYSGGGYVIVQLLMTQATERTFPELMHDLILEPAAMTHSDFDQPPAPARAVTAATGYQASGEPLPGHWHVYPELAPAGLWTTPSDLARFAIALQTAGAGAPGAILNQTTTRTMMTRTLGNWGLGVDLGPPGGPGMFEHGGDNAGFQSEMWAFTGGRRQGATIMINGADGGFPREILRAIASAYGWPVLGPKVVTPFPWSDAEIDAVTGVYEAPGVGRLTITSEAGRVYGVVQARGPGRLEIVPTGPGAAVLATDGEKVDFVKDAGGKVVGLDYAGIVTLKKVSAGAAP